MTTHSSSGQKENEENKAKLELTYSSSIISTDGEKRKEGETWGKTSDGKGKKKKY